MATVWEGRHGTCAWALALGRLTAIDHGGTHPDRRLDRDDASLGECEPRTQFQHPGQPVEQHSPEPVIEVGTSPRKPKSMASFC